MEKNFDSHEWRQFLPIPVCEDHPEYQSLYFKAWELAHQHVRHISGMPQDPYMDEALCDTQIWIWDTCFMAQFCKYAQNVFPGVESFRNFYEVLYDGKALPKIIPSENEPFWTHAVPNRENDIYIHIADNPPLFAWGEYENALLRGDREYLKDLLYNKRYLQQHYEWFEGLKGPVKPRGVFLPTYLIAEELGYRWEGGASGMDNTPRGRKVPRDGRVRPNDPNLLWVDAICQQALSAKSIASLFAILGDRQGEAEWNQKYLAKKQIVNQYYWDADDCFYYDIDVETHQFCKVMTIASYWALTSEIASREQAEALAKLLSDEQTFGGEVPLITLARKDGDYCSEGQYWRGSLWLPTAYAALKGLARYGYSEESHLAAIKILEHMLATHRQYEPHTIWECYSPEKAEPGTNSTGERPSRPDFCGWSALGPISIYIEYVLGFQKINAFEKTIEWALPKEFVGEVGIKNLRFGTVLTDIVAKNGTCLVTSNEDYTLIVDGKAHAIQKGSQTIAL